LSEEIQKLIQDIQSKFHIIGRENELRKALTAKYAGRHLLLEGEVGVGKTVLAAAIAKIFDQPLIRVDGDERYNETKLVGYFDPPSVLSKGYNWETFIPGPLTQAMTEGGILFLNELNRMPEGTQNILLPAMDEGLIQIPKLGEVRAKPGFFIIATQNPEEHVGVTALGEALKDRFVWIRVTYQTEEEEIEITKVNSNYNDLDILSKIVRIVRLSRKYPDIKRGASVRAAIDMANLLKRYNKINLDTWIAVAIMALATKIELEDGVEKPLEVVIEELVKEALSGF